MNPVNQRPGSPDIRSRGWPGALLLATVALIGIVGFFYLQSVTAAARKVAADNLAAVAELKVREIVNWRAERLSDGNLLMGNPVTAEIVARWLANPEATNAEPLSLRLLWRSEARVPVFAKHDHEIPESSLGTVARPHRHPRRSTGGEIQRDGR